MENQKMMESPPKMKLTLSIGVVAVLFLLAGQMEDFLLAEAFMALTVVACLNVFRVMNDILNLPIEK
jgi:hypothetical protein